MAPRDLYTTPNALAPHYTRFRVSERLLLTGHSHQAWPDRGFEGQRQAWLDAAELLDEKWDRAFEKAERVRRGYRRLLGDPDGPIALAESTHDLVVRFLSALPLRDRPRVVTTDAEFHSARRQLDRLAEEGLEVVRVPAHPTAEAGERVAEAVDDRTAAAMVSSVFYTSGHIAGGLEAAAEACRQTGAELLVDAYHALNVVPFSLDGLEDAWVVGGGYKYCQLGEGNCCLRVPPGREPRPVVTGWFAEFAALEEAKDDGRVVYGEGPSRFAGSTYDPTSHYRAAEVFDHFEELALTPSLLREVSRHQVGLLAEGVDALDADPALLDRDRSVPPERIGGFLALRSPRAGELRAGLRERGVMTDHRADVLRLGPAPYLSDAQLRDAVAALADVVRELDA
ncbi:MAG: kynureninase [Gemmatimonadota bacterium]